MSSGRKCKNCGSSDIEVDPARGDAVCTACGSVLEDNIIVAEVQFEEGTRGTSSAIGQFVAADSQGGSTKFGASFHVAGGLESREVTIKRAQNGIQQLGNQLQLSQHCIETACNFFKMALSSNLTRGRKNTHIHAACVYLSCRTEGTAHLLIDISDVLQICCYALGRTYLRLSQALCINVPSVDPCLYILRFASKLEFGSKTQQVTNTALRLVQRMKRDSLHSGRRPSGLCGAALLFAARLHEFNRSINDIIKVVKVHESTIRKRLMEFGDTPSSALTLEEFMTVDLEEEQDPPCFKVARKKDKERLQKILEEEGDSISDLQKQIDAQLDQSNKNFKSGTRRTKKAAMEQEGEETREFIEQSTFETIKEIVTKSSSIIEGEVPTQELGPNIDSIGLPSSLHDTTNAIQPESNGVDLDLTFDDIDEEELDSYIMTESESSLKNKLWHELNADFLKKQKDKEEQLQKEREEGKPEKKRKRPFKKHAMGPTTSAGEAIEKIIQEKKISTKINYEVLKSLNSVQVPSDNQPGDEPTQPDVPGAKRARLSTSNVVPSLKKASRSKKTDMGMPFVEETPASSAKKKPNVEEEKKENVNTVTNAPEEEEEDADDYYEEEQPPDEAANEMGVLEMLKQHHETEGGGDDYGYGDDGYDDDY